MNNNSSVEIPVGENGTNTGLAVGLSLFFLFLVIIVCAIIYKYHSKIRSMVQFHQRSRQKKEDYSETTQCGSHQYTSTCRQESIAQTPIYENLTRSTGYNKPAVNQRRPPGEPEEDVYLQCDMPDDAIYSNDPQCNLSILPEEDVYILPDS